MRQLVRLFEIVGGQQQGEALPRQPPHLLPHHRPALRIEAGGRLVEEEDRRPVHQTHGQVEAPLHSPRVRVGGAVRRRGHLEQRQQLLDAGAQRRRRQPVELPLQSQVLPPGGGRIDSRRLGHVADPPPHLARPRRDVDAVDAGGASRRRRQRREDAHGRGLARAIGAEQREHLARLDGEGHPVERHHAAAVGLAQLAHLDRARRVHPASVIASRRGRGSGRCAPEGRPIAGPDSWRVAAR